MKVFVSNLDSPFGYNISNLLSQTIVGSRVAEEGGEEEETTPPPPAQDGDAPAPASKEKLVKEKYTVVGSLTADQSLDLPHGPSQTPAKPGRMIETGDRKKDSARRDAIEKIPNRGEKPKWVSNAVPVNDKK